jgi:hypothetical protein
MMGKAIIYYEIDKRKAQEDREILACVVQAGKRKRSFVHGYGRSSCAGVCMVGHPRPLASPQSEQRGLK